MSDFYLKPTSPTKTTVDSYYYKFDSYSDSMSGTKSYWLIIIFENGKFDRISINDKNRVDLFSASGLKLMNLINEEVKKLEKFYEV